MQFLLSREFSRVSYARGAGSSGASHSLATHAEARASVEDAFSPCQYAGRAPRAHARPVRKVEALEPSRVGVLVESNQYEITTDDERALDELPVGGEGRERVSLGGCRQALSPFSVTVRTAGRIE